MNLFTKNNLPPPRHDETIFRISLWGTLFSFLLVLSGFFGGIALFVIGYHVSRTWVMIVSALYTLIMWWVCSAIFHTLMAIRSPANWLARIGSGGILLKYRSYLHDDSPGEDPIALHLSWAEIADAQLQQEIHTSSDTDGTSRIKHWFLAIKLDPGYITIDRVKEALEFESQRKPDHFKVDDLKHELFIARKNRADEREIARIKAEIARVKQTCPGTLSKMRFHDRPIDFISPDLLKMELTHITPGKKKLRELLAQYTTVIGDQKKQFDMEKPMTEAEFNTLLTTLLSRNEKIEAIKLVQFQRGLSTSEAVAFIEKHVRVS
jgi:ribosomal protein L7/L12